MTSDVSRHETSAGRSSPVITSARLEHGIAEGRRLQGLAVRRAFAAAARFLGRLPLTVAARLHGPGSLGSDPCVRPLR
jgi:hypothetical protein